MPDLFIDYFMMSAFYDLAWLYILHGNTHVTKLQWANTQGHIFSLVVCCVKMRMTITGS